MATVVEESGTPPPSVTTDTVEEGRTTTEMTALQAALEPPAGAGLDCADVVMVLVDDDSVSPPPAGDRDVITSTVLAPSPAAGAASAEDVTDLAACRYVDFPSIGTIELDAPELPSNDREVLEAVTERMFAEPSILDTIASVASALRQYEGTSGSAPPRCTGGGRGGSRGVREWCGVGSGRVRTIANLKGTRRVPPPAR
jgi:hypothetical protein